MGKCRFLGAPYRDLGKPDNKICSEDQARNYFNLDILYTRHAGCFRTAEEKESRSKRAIKEGELVGSIN